MYTKNCVKCASNKVAYLYGRREAILGKGGKQYPIDYAEYVNYICEDCKEKWHVDLAEKEGPYDDEGVLNAWGKS